MPANKKQIKRELLDAARAGVAQHVQTMRGANLGAEIQSAHLDQNGFFRVRTFLNGPEGGPTYFDISIKEMT